jgi:hypothetical protein
MLYDFLVIRQFTPSNPAHAVRAPKYVVKKGKTPVWSREEAKTLLDSISKHSCPDYGTGRSLPRCLTASPVRAQYLIKLKSRRLLSQWRAPEAETP